VITFVCGWLFGLLQPARDESELRGLVYGIDEPSEAQPLSNTAIATVD
jgi:hypothetical protein